jgi:hypothetical protein
VSRFFFSGAVGTESAGGLVATAARLLNTKTLQMQAKKKVLFSTVLGSYRKKGEEDTIFQ